MINQVFDNPRPRLALWSMPRGNSKSTMAAALGLYGLHGDGEEGASICVVAKDERQARIIFNTAVRMTELSKSLSQRTYIYHDYLKVPRTGSTFQVLPAESDRLEGLDPSICLIDEIGVVDRRVYETVALAMGKREHSLTLAIGTPSPMGTDSVMWDLRAWALEHPDDKSFAFTEYAAPAGCDIDDEAAWAIANPALNDFLWPDALRATLPPKTREAVFRRARLGQWTEQADDCWLQPGAWASRSTGLPLSDGEEIVLAFDGSFSQDSTALVAATVSQTPHIDVIGHWFNPGDPEWRVDVLEIEQAIRAACLRYRVMECTADPFRWQRSLQVLERDGMPVSEFPQTSARMSPATIGLHEAVTNAQVTHSGNAALAEHVMNARVTEDARGTRLSKESKDSPRKIDLAVAAVMAHSRALHLASKKRSKKVVAW
jgi:phage terminase large subunit-like protein